MDAAVGTAPAESEATRISRRRFLSIASGVAFLVAAVEGAGIAVASVWPKIQEKKLLKMPVARVQDIPVNGGITLLEQGLVIVRPEGGIKPLPAGTKTGLRASGVDVIDKLSADARQSGIIVLDTTCSHLGCKVSWSDKEGKIICPCHNGLYNAQGEVVGGPPPRPLDRIAFSIVNGEVVVETEVGA